MGKIEQIQEAIEKAERLESKLTNDIIDGVGGFTSPRIRHLMNNLGGISQNYLEVGIFLGATYVSAAYGNDHLCCTGIDDFSEFNENKDAEDTFIANCKKSHVMCQYIKDDCFNIKPDEILFPQDLYLFDGSHDYESQKRAITHFLPMMADEFILVIDDFDWKDVHEGTSAGIKESAVEVLFEQVLTGTDWHNGIYIALLKKIA